MNTKTLSVCMIVKDEEKNIDRCLKSIYNIADEIIVVDTGSSDNTVNIAKSYNAKIGFFKWNNNFSDARNASLDMATKDWILFLDADEEISKEEGLKLKQLINKTNLEAINCRLVNIIQNNNVGDAIVLRLFKNNPKYRFEGKMHEQIVFSIRNLYGEKSIGVSDIKITHYGYDPDVSDIELKKKRNLDLLQSYDEKDKDGYYYYSLGNEYSRIDDYETAINTYYKAYDTNCKSSYMPYLCVNISKVWYRYKKYLKAINEVDRFAKSYPNLRDLYFLKALSAIECNKFSIAKNAIFDYLHCDIDSYVYPNSNFDSLYNIAQLLTNVKKYCIPHEKNLLSSLIILPIENDFVINTIKSLNEICDEIIIVVPKLYNINTDKLEDFGAKIVLSDSTDAGENFLLGAKNCSCKYTLLMKYNEMLPLESQTSLVNVLSTKDDIEFLNLLVSDTNNQTISNEFRLFKNKDIFDNFKFFNSFTNFVEQSKRLQSEIIINRY